MEKWMFAIHILLVFGSLMQSIKAETYIEYTCSPVGELPNYAQHDLYVDGINIQETSFLLFQVKCPGNAYILLQKDQGNYDNGVVEIVLGVLQNTYSVIRDKLDLKMDAMYKEDGVVCSKEYRNFWVGWDGDKNGTVYVGKGDIPYVSGFMRWHGLNHKLNYVSVGNGYNTGYWKFKYGTTMSEKTTEKSAAAKSTEALNLVISTNTTHSLETTGMEPRTATLSALTNNTLNNKSNVDSANKDSSTMAISISVPISVATLVGLVLTAVLVIRRRRLRLLEHENTVKRDNPDPKQINHQAPGVVNEAFEGHSKQHANQVNSLDSTLYEEETEDNRKSEDVIYENNNTESRLNDIVEDEYGYGQFIPNTNADTIYQNTINHSREVKPFIAQGIYSNTENEYSSQYLNVKIPPVVSNESSSDEIFTEQILEKPEDDDDPLYEHAKAGGHDWRFKEKDKPNHTTEEDSAVLQNVYENTTWNSSNGKCAKSQDTSDNCSEYDQTGCDIPFYLALEDYQSNEDNNRQIKSGEKDELHEYDYASANNNQIVMSERNIKPQSYDIPIGNENTDRHYLILEKENVIQEENSEYDLSCSHEYFILEKVDM